MLVQRRLRLRLGSRESSWLLLLLLLSLVSWLKGGGGGGRRRRRGGGLKECLCLCMSVWNERKKVMAKESKGIRKSKGKRGKKEKECGLSEVKKERLWEWACEITMLRFQGTRGRKDGQSDCDRGSRNTVGGGHHHHHRYYCAAYMYAITTTTAVVYHPGDFI